MRTVITFGIWDLLHVGHLALLEKAKNRGDYLIVGVADDPVVIEDKGRPPVVPAKDRARLLRGLRCVDDAHIYLRLDFIEPLNYFKPNVIVVGEEWGTAERHAQVEQWADRYEVSLVRLPRYPFESTTGIRHRVQGQLCHDSPEEDYASFCDGCDEYQKKLFGRCRSEELKEIGYDGIRMPSKDGSTGN